MSDKLTYSNVDVKPVEAMTSEEAQKLIDYKVSLAIAEQEYQDKITAYKEQLEAIKEAAAEQAKAADEAAAALLKMATDFYKNAK